MQRTQNSIFMSSTDRNYYRPRHPFTPAETGNPAQKAVFVQKFIVYFRRQDTERKTTRTKEKPYLLILTTGCNVSPSKMEMANFMFVLIANLKHSVSLKSEKYTPLNPSKWLKKTGGK